VSETAGDVTDRIELLGLAQLLLQRDAFGHVAADALCPIKNKNKRYFEFVANSWNTSAGRWWRTRQQPCGV
jgi:hypothetical protein